VFNDGDRTGGGGGSDVRINGDTIYYRAIVAGGGGGGLTYANNSYAAASMGGAGGGLNGGNGSKISDDAQMTIGAGGGVSQGGIMGFYASGSFGQGGSFQGAAGSTGVAGGGGGWYGGGPGLLPGGGSGWLFTKANFDAWDPADYTLGLAAPSKAEDKTKFMLDDYGDASAFDYELSDTVTINGTELMPDPLADPASSDSLTIYGNPNGGFVRVTYLGP
jgi:hypothetical protein